MRLTIVVDDTAVYTDDAVYIIPDIVELVPEGIWALQWLNGKGWIEFNTDEDWNKPSNQRITELPEWAIACKARWSEEHLKMLEEQARQAEQVQPIGNISSVGAQEF